MEKNQNKKGLKKIILLLLLFVGLGASITAGAYWVSYETYTIPAPSSIDGTYTVNIGQGEPVPVTTTLAAFGSNGETKKLVPTGYVVDSNSQTDSVSFNITVSWDRDAAFDTSYTGTGNLVASTLSLENTAGDDLEELFTVTYSVATNPFALGSDTVVTIKVVFTQEPADLTEYNKVANQDLSLTVQFAVTPTP